MSKWMYKYKVDKECIIIPQYIAGMLLYNLRLVSTPPTQPPGYHSIGVAAYAYTASRTLPQLETSTGPGGSPSPDASP